MRADVTVLIFKYIVYIRHAQNYLNVQRKIQLQDILSQKTWNLHQHNKYLILTCTIHGQKITTT
jgi:hypothetical protein